MLLRRALPETKTSAPSCRLYLFTAPETTDRRNPAPNRWLLDETFEGGIRGRSQFGGLDVIVLGQFHKLRLRRRVENR